MSEELEVTPIGDTDALFLDFDGTLSPLRMDPGAVHLTETCAAALVRLARRLGGAVAVISGRDVRDLATRIPSELWRIGNHGLEVCAPGEMPGRRSLSAPADLQAALGSLAEERDGVVLEDKGPVLAVHYRADPDAAEAVRQRVEAEVANLDDYTSQVGKMVVEAKPVEANKGRAIRRLARREPFRGRRLVMVGDDTTDEDAFEVVLAAGGVAIKVGPGVTRARRRLADAGEVERWLSAEEGTP